MSSKAGKRPTRPTAHEAKIRAIFRVRNGESKASVARDIGVPESTLRGWCKSEDKITQQLQRESKSPETDESGEPREKKMKLDENVQPFNLSLRATLQPPPAAPQPSAPGPQTPAGPSSYSPNSENRYNIDYSKLGNDSKMTPLDLKTKKESTSKHRQSNSPMNHVERERNRAAELAALRVELGLNRPEIIMPHATNVNSTDLANLGALWNHLLSQQQSQHMPQIKKMPSPVGNNINVANGVTNGSNGHRNSSIMGNINGGSLLTTVNQIQGTQSPLRLPNEKIPLEESVRYWLNNSTPPHTSPNSVSSTNGFPTSLSTPINGNTTSPLAGMTPDQSSLFWSLYKNAVFASQYANGQYSMPLQQPTPDKQILYQQLTKYKEVNNAENLSVSPPFPEDRQEARNIRTAKARSVLDNLLLNNNIIREKDDAGISLDEAVVHGAKFLNWLENCSNPSVTSMHIVQFRSLFNNVKASADRKNGLSGQIKTKVKRK